MKNVMKERVKHFINKRKMSVKALPEFINIFKKSQSISVHKGKTHYLLKTWGKRKWDEIEEDNKERLKRAKEETIKLNETIYTLEEKIEYYKGRDDEYLKQQRKTCQTLWTKHNWFWWRTKGIKFIQNIF